MANLIAAGESSFSHSRLVVKLQLPVESVFSVQNSNVAFFHHPAAESSFCSNQDWISSSLQPESSLTCTPDLYFFPELQTMLHCWRMWSCWTRAAIQSCTETTKQSQRHSFALCKPLLKEHRDRKHQHLPSPTLRHRGLLMYTQKHTPSTQRILCSPCSLFSYAPHRSLRPLPALRQESVNYG